jgi:hypothetical protein
MVRPDEVDNNLVRCLIERANAFEYVKSASVAHPCLTVPSGQLSVTSWIWLATLNNTCVRRHPPL